MQFKNLAVVAFAARAIASPNLVERQVESSLDTLSVYNVLKTALPPSLVSLALADPSSASSEIAAEFSGGQTPTWFQNLPSDIKTYIVPQETVAPSITSALSSIVASANSSISSAISSAVSSINATAPNTTTIATTARNSTTTSTTGGSSTLGGESTGAGGASTTAASSSTSSAGAALPTAVIGGGLFGALSLIGMLAL
ncbi:MAG: hypothetical protein M1820_002379 [Bogoriella megaspora]|nr:MAG: hypothetical protein M1820_002379 [Bogoriella megaspora]